MTRTWFAAERIVRRMVATTAVVAITGSLAPRQIDAQMRLPGEADVPSLGEQRSLFQDEIRGQLAMTIQEWVNVWERNDAEMLARYYTDRSLLVTAGGASRGRGAIGAVWQERLPGRHDVQVELGEVLPGPSLAALTGRISYRTADADGVEVTASEQFLMVFDEHRGRWMIRGQAFGPGAGATGGRTAIRANGRTPTPPQRLVLRLVGEAYAGRSQGSDAADAPPWNAAGGGLGLEIGRLLEFRGNLWQELGGRSGADDPLRSYAGELRVHPGTVWRLRPNLSAGAALVTGTVSPDEEAMPVLGAGVGIELKRGLSLQLAARSYLPQSPTVREYHWLGAPRDQVWFFSGGMSYAIGRRPDWRDPPRTEMQTIYEMGHRSDVEGVVRTWYEAVRSPQRAGLHRAYSRGALLLVAGQQNLRGADEVVSYLDAHGRSLGGGGLEVTDLRISGNVAILTVRLHGAHESAQGSGDAGDPGQDRDVLNVLERVDGEWLIRYQAIAPPVPAS